MIRVKTSMASATGGVTSRPSAGPGAEGRYGPFAGHKVRCPRDPWLIFAVVVVPLAVVVYVATRRRTAAGEHPASEDAKAKALTEQEFAEAEAYEAKWHEEDKKRYHEERLP